MKVVWVAWITLVNWAHDQCCDHWIVFRSIPSCTISHNGLRNINHRWRVWAIFNRISKVIRVCFGFALLRSVISWQNSRHFLNQWETKPIRMACSHAFSRAWRRLHVYVCCDWLEWVLWLWFLRHSNENCSCIKARNCLQTGVKVSAGKW